MVACAPRHDSGQIPSLKPRVDIDDSDVRRAAIQHRQQRCHALERGPVTDAGRHGEDRATDPATDNRGEGSLHPGYDDQGIRLLESRHLLEQPLWSGNSDIGDEIALDSHPA